MAIALLCFSLVEHVEGSSPQQSAQGRGITCIRKHATRGVENFGRRVSLCVTKYVNEKCSLPTNKETLP
jgi:hypothetical protein